MSDEVTLTKAEMDSLIGATHEDYWDDEAFSAVEAIIAARLEPVERERDRAQEHMAYHLRDFRPTADMKATGDLAVDMAAYAGRLKARAEKAEAALADLWARVEALADEWDQGGINYRPTAADALRPLLGEA